MTKNIIIYLVVVIAVLIISLGIYQRVSSPATPENSQTLATSTPDKQLITNQATSTMSTSSEATTSQETFKNGSHLITLDTSMGKIEFETYDADAPRTVQNFIQLAEKNFYSNVIFHRIIKGFMIQGGDPTGTGMGGPGYQFADELNPNTPSYQAGYQKGVVAMANAGPNTNGSQFFIMLADYPLPHNYTIFGKVIKGQDTVESIGNLKTDANDRPLNPPVIKSVSVETIK